MGKLNRHPSEDNVYGIFNDSFPPILDGVTLTVENYVHWLKESGRTPCVVTPWNPIAEDCGYEVMRFFSLPIRSRRPYRYGYPKLDPFIWKRLRQTDFRIVHAHCPFSSGRLAVYVKKKQNVPLVGTFHSKYRSDLEHSFKQMPWCVPIIMRRILDFFNACDEVWIPQAHVEETVREYGYKGPLSVVENGNDFSGIIKGGLSEYKEAAKRRLGKHPQDINLLFVGQHIWAKGVGLVIESLSRLDGKTGFHMDFAGDGYASAEMKSMVSRLGLSDRVTFHGVVKDRKRLSELYAASDLFVFPSRYDNAPLVLREAAAMGTPGILIEGSTASEVVRNGENGFTVCADAGEIASLVDSLSRNPERLRKVAQGARDTLVRSWENVVEEVIDRYESLVKRHGKH